MKNKKVAVIVPIYNVAPYLAQCLDSIVSQTHSNILALLVDDGSSDTSLEIAKKFVASDERFMLITKQNGGQSSARNVGLAYLDGELSCQNKSLQDSSGGGAIDVYNLGSNPYNASMLFCSTSFANPPQVDYVMFLDSDDWLEKECIESCLSCAEGVDFVWFDYREDYENLPANQYTIESTIIEDIQKEGKLKTLDFLHLVKASRHTLFWYSAFMLINFSLLQKNKLRFTERIIHEDVLFATMLLAFTDSIYILPTKFYHWRKYKKQTQQIIPSYIYHIYTTFNKDMAQTSRYYQVGSFLIIAFAFNEFCATHKLNPNIALLQDITLPTLTGFGLFITDFPKDPLALIPKLPNLKAQLPKHIKPPILTKIAMYAPKIYYFLAPFVPFYLSLRQAEKRFRYHRNKLKAKWSANRQTKD